MLHQILVQPEAQPMVVELLNQDGHEAVYIHLDNVVGTTSVPLPNGTLLTILAEDGDAYVERWKSVRAKLTQYK